MATNSEPVPWNEGINLKPDEVDFYLRDKDISIDMLNKYPQIKQLFLKYNTTIPTSAPVERLFSQAARVLTVKLDLKNITDNFF